MQSIPELDDVHHLCPLDHAVDTGHRPLHHLCEPLELGRALARQPLVPGQLQGQLHPEDDLLLGLKAAVHLKVVRLQVVVHFLVVLVEAPAASLGHPEGHLVPSCP